MQPLRRLTVRVKTGLGLAASADEEIASKRKVFYEQLIPEADELGQGLSEHLTFLRGYYENGEKLGEVLASFLGGGDFDRSQEWALATGEEKPVETIEDKSVQAATRIAQERWAYLNNVARRSAAAILVKYGLEPLRKLSNETVPKVKAKLDAYDATRVDDASRKKKKQQQQQQQYDAQTSTEIREAANGALEASFREFDQVVADVACALAACQAELCAATAEYLDEAFELLPQDAATKFRNQMRDIIKIGGPALISKERSGARKAFELFTGKKRLEDYKREKEQDERKQQLQREQFEAAIRQTKSADYDTPSYSNAGRKPIKSIRATNIMLQQQAQSLSPASLSTTPPLDRSSNATKNKVVRAIYDCQAEDQGELSFSRGDLIEITDSSDPDWLQGKLPDGTIGLLPANYVTQLDSAPPRKSIRPTSALAQLALATDSTTNLIVRALFDCEADEEGELSFSKGDRITVLDNSDPDWLKGKLSDGSIGLFPANYVAEDQAPPRKSVRASTAIAQLAALNQAASSSSREVSSPKYVVALFDCSPDEDGELAFFQGDRITILDDSDPDWFKGQLNDTVGLIPANYVSVSSD